MNIQTLPDTEEAVAAQIVDSAFIGQKFSEKRFGHRPFNFWQ